MILMRHAMLSFVVGYMLLLAPQAHAEPIPADVLKHDYENCLGGSGASADPDRAKFCGCVRDQMSRWDLQTYTNIALEQMHSGDTTHPPAKVQEIANLCISKVMGK